MQLAQYIRELKVFQAEDVGEIETPILHSILCPLKKVLCFKMWKI